MCNFRLKKWNHTGFYTSPLSFLPQPLLILEFCLKIENSNLPGILCTLSSVKQFFPSMEREREAIEELLPLDLIASGNFLKRFFQAKFGHAVGAKSHMEWRNGSFLEFLQVIPFGTVILPCSVRRRLQDYSELKNWCFSGRLPTSNVGYINFLGEVFPMLVILLMISSRGPNRLVIWKMIKNQSLSSGWEEKLGPVLPCKVQALLFG